MNGVWHYYDHLIFLIAYIFLQFDPVHGSDAFTESAAIVGRTAKLYCRLDFTGSAQVVWFSPDKRQLTVNKDVRTDDVRVTINVPYQGDYELNIAQVRKTDAGNYTCYINTQPAVTKIVRLSVHYPPSIDDVSADITVQQGDNVTLSCTTSGSPRPVINWFRFLPPDGSQRWTSNVLSRQIDSFTFSSRLLIFDATWKDAGKYICESDNGVAPNAESTIRVDVEFGPIMQHSQAVVGQLIGQDALLQCIVTANPELSLAWLKDGEPLALSSKHMINNNTWHFNLYTKTYVLLITDVTEQDFGIYTCSASNAIGQSEQSIKLVDANTLSTSGGDISLSASAVGLAIALIICIIILFIVALVAFFVIYQRQHSSDVNSSTSEDQCFEGVGKCRVGKQKPATASVVKVWKTNPSLHQQQLSEIMPLQQAPDSSKAVVAVS